MNLKISFGEIEVSEMHLASNRFLSVDETMIQNKLEIKKKVVSPKELFKSFTSG